MILSGGLRVDLAAPPHFLSFMRYDLLITGAFSLIFLAASPADAQQRRRSESGSTTRSAQLKTTATKAASGKAAAATELSDNEARSTSPRAMAMQELDENSIIRQSRRDSKIHEGADVRIGYGLAAPAPYYNFDGTTLSWREPNFHHTHYLFVTIQDAANGQVLPGCKVSATVTDGSGKDAPTSVTLHETWDPKLRHYGENVSIPETATTGTLTIRIQPPVYRRRDQLLGAFFSSPVTTTFPEVDLTTNSLTNVEIGNKQEQKVIWPEGRRPYSLDVQEKTPPAGKQGKSEDP